jgi:hypothetical protein
MIRTLLRARPAALSLLTLWGCQASMSDRQEGGQAQPGGGTPSAGPSQEEPGGVPVEGAPLQPGVTPNPEASGSAALRRLSRTEYAYTVRDLLGAPTSIADSLSADDIRGGFDNNIELLGVIQPTQLDLYERAAEQLANEFLAGPERARYVTCQSSADAACQREVLGRFASDAWRRPADAGELDRLLAVTKTAAELGESGDGQLAVAMRAILTSPHFLFRVELDPDPSATTPHPLGGYEMASRLSYLLWSSMPDQALFQAAAAGGLASSTELLGQIARMLDDQKASALTTNFAGQWLRLNALTGHKVDANRFATYDAALAGSMLEESYRLFGHLTSSNRPLSELVSANYGFIDERLASHYGVSNAAGNFARVEFSDVPRGGLLGHASVLTVTSYPTNTSVVRRGVWVLEHLLCVHPPPPPVGVVIEDLPSAESAPDTTQRQRLERHRADPACGACHALMDPIGLGLENFDAIGRWRDQEGGQPIDATGELTGHGAFNGPRELSALVAADRRYSGCAAEKLVTYALGRPPSSTEQELLSSVGSASDSAGPSLRQMLERLVLSDTFRLRRGI